MKFSWNLTNSFLKTERTSLALIKEQLILSGLEIEDVEELNGDIILDLSITSNRKEINCAFNLAREISILTDKKIQTKAIKFLTQKFCPHKQMKEGLKYVRIHTNQ